MYAIYRMMLIDI